MRLRLKGSIFRSFFFFHILSPDSTPLQPRPHPHNNPTPNPTLQPIYEARTKPHTSPTNPLIHCTHLKRRHEMRPRACRKKIRRTCLAAVLQPPDNNPFFLSGKRSQRQPVFSCNPAVCYRAEKQMEGWRERESRRGGVEGGCGDAGKRRGARERASRGWLTTGRLKQTDG